MLRMNNLGSNAQSVKVLIREYYFHGFFFSFQFAKSNFLNVFSREFRDFHNQETNKAKVVSLRLKVHKYNTKNTLVSNSNIVITMS